GGASLRCGAGCLPCPRAWRATAARPRPRSWACRTGGEDGSTSASSAPADVDARARRSLKTPSPSPIPSSKQNPRKTDRSGHHKALWQRQRAIRGRLTRHPPLAKSKNRRREVVKDRGAAGAPWFGVDGMELGPFTSRDFVKAFTNPAIHGIHEPDIPS